MNLFPFAHALGAGLVVWSPKRLAPRAEDVLCYFVADGGKLGAGTQPSLLCVAAMGLRPIVIASTLATSANGCDRSRAPTTASAPVAERAAAAAPNPEPDPVTIDLERAHEYLAEFEDACSADNGALLGRSICGPILFVDPVTRDVVANEQDGNRALRARSGLFVGRWPSELPIANTALDWHGTRWTMVMWNAIPNEGSARLALLLHEAFHRIQAGALARRRAGKTAPLGSPLG